jgi:hypothetical protein
MSTGKVIGIAVGAAAVLMLVDALAVRYGYDFRNMLPQKAAA